MKIYQNYEKDHETRTIALKIVYVIDSAGNFNMILHKVASTNVIIKAQNTHYL